MALMTLTIEVRFDFDDAKKNDLMVSVAKTKAKEILTTALLLADGRKPEIAISSSDMFVGSTEIEMFEPGEEDA